MKIVNRNNATKKRECPPLMDTNSINKRTGSTILVTCQCFSFISFSTFAKFDAGNQPISTHFLFELFPSFQLQYFIHNFIDIHFFLLFLFVTPLFYFSMYLFFFYFILYSNPFEFSLSVRVIEEGLI